MAKKHESYRHLIWVLAKTDFTLRYHGSVLGYLWALLKPLLLFAILYFVFTSVFNPRTQGNNVYALELLTAILLFTFFSEGTSSALRALRSKAQLVTKIYVPRWTLIVASTLNMAMIFGMNLLIVVALFALQWYMPPLAGVGMFFIYVMLLYILILAFGFITAPLFVKYADLGMIWEVLLQAIFYASPIIYPLSFMPEHLHKWVLLNPLAAIVHFSRVSLLHDQYPQWWQFVALAGGIIALFVFGLFLYKHTSKRIAENI